jgi:hypothetical protein
VDFNACATQLLGQFSEVTTDTSAALPLEDLVVEADADVVVFGRYVRKHD